MCGGQNYFLPVMDMARGGYNSENIIPKSRWIFRWIFLSYEVEHQPWWPMNSPRSPCATHQACAGSWDPPWHKSSGNWTFRQAGLRMYTFQIFRGHQETKLFVDLCRRRLGRKSGAPGIVKTLQGNKFKQPSAENIQERGMQRRKEMLMDTHIYTRIHTNWY